MSAVISDIHEREYGAIREATAILARPDASPFLVQGADRSDFLHRMTTNDINSLRPGQSAVTVLTSPTARIQFVFTVICRESDLLILPSPGESQALASCLRGQIFFMDQVSIEAVGATRWRVVGQEAARSLAAAGQSVDDATDGAWQEQDGVLVLRQDAYDVPGYEIVGLSASAHGLISTLEESGATLLSDSAAYEARRIELGRPAPGHELVDAYTPLETGMAWACSDNKGCYTGQEIIARQITYDKVTRGLVGLLCEGEASAGDTVQAGGKPAGSVTSAAYSPELAQHVALAVVQRAHNAPGTEVDVVLASGDVASARVVEIPFS